MADYRVAFDETDEEYADDECDDDQLYDVEREEDIGEPEDRANDELERRIAEHEERADMDALQGLEITSEASESQGDNTVNLTKKRKASSWTDRQGRGPTKGIKKANGPMHVQFDSLNRPCGPYRHQYGKNIGLCMRKLSINWDWKSVSSGLKDALWQDTMSLFNVSNDPTLKKTFLSSVARRFGDFKGKLVSGWITKTRKRMKKEDNRETHQLYKHIKFEEWELFKKTKTTEEAQKICEMAIRNTKKNVHHHHMGTRTYDESRKKWIEDGFYPACNLGPLPSSSDTRIGTNRGDDWYCAVHKKDKKMGRREIPNPETKKAAELYVYKKANEGPFTDEEIDEIRNKWAMYFATNYME